jgi:hypothetical protein
MATNKPPVTPEPEEAKELGVPVQAHYLGLPVPEIETLAKYMVAAKFFPNTESLSQAVVKILAGQEMGVTPVQAIKGIHIIKGNFQIAANLMASKVKSSPRYDYDVKELSNEVAQIEFFELQPKRKSLGTETFTIADARKAGTQNLDKFPKNMLFARALSNGVRFYCPDIFGQPVYVEGEIVDDSAPQISPEPAGRTQAPEVVEGTVIDPEPSKGAGYVSVEPDPTEEPVKVENYREDERPDGPATIEQLKAIADELKKKGITDPTTQREIVYKIAQVKSRAELTSTMANHVLGAIDLGDKTTLELMLDLPDEPEKPDELPF